MTRAKPKRRVVVVAKTAMEVAAPSRRPTAKREAAAQDKRANRVVELPDPNRCPYCRSTYTDLQTRQRIDTFGEYTASAQVVCTGCQACGPVFHASKIAGSIVHVRKALEAWNRVAGA